jgi:tetratricopeptide (TPR) repeat protein
VAQTPATDAELDEIARRCGRLPLALRVAGTFLVRHRNWPVQDYLRALADERGRLAKLKLKGLPKLDVAVVLGFSARQLAEEDRPLAERWQTLVVFSENFDLAGAAAVWEADADEALDGLGELVVRSMVRFDPDTDRYRLHDLMRDVAQVPLKDQDGPALGARLKAARAKHARHYCEVLREANRLYRDGGDGVLRGLAQYDLEARNIQAAQSWAAAHSNTDNAATTLCIEFPEGGGLVVSLRLPRLVWISWLNAQLDGSRTLGDRRREGYALGDLGNAWRNLGEPRRAIEFHEQALQISREIGDRRGEGQDLANLGNAWTDPGEPRRAIEFHKQALAIMREIRDRMNEGGVLGNLGNAWTDLDEPRRAIEFYEQALAIAREIGDRIGEGISLYNLGVAMDALGERAEALRRARDALAIYQAIGAKHHVATVRALLAGWGVEDSRS